MKYRSRLNKSRSRRNYRRNSGTHPKNLRTPVMRGGIRL